MKITVNKVKRELMKNFGWGNFDARGDDVFLINELIKDTLKAVEEINKKQNVKK